MEEIAGIYHERCREVLKLETCVGDRPAHIRRRGPKRFATPNTKRVMLIEVFEKNEPLKWARSE